MDDSFALFLAQQQKTKIMQELDDANEFTSRYGLCLSEMQITQIADRRVEALKATGRLEFGQGILKTLVKSFCDSPYITQENYEETILELIDTFYYFKNETMDMITDDELIRFMKDRFDGVCQGSLDYLADTCLSELCGNTEYGDEADETDIYGDLFL